jgi:hypothetical protein
MIDATLRSPSRREIFAATQVTVLRNDLAP